MYVYAVSYTCVAFRARNSYRLAGLKQDARCARESNSDFATLVRKSY